MNVERYEELLHRFDGASFSAAEAILHELRMVKDEREIALLRKACELADFAVETGVNELAEGKTELDIIAAIEFEVKKKGVSGMSFDTMVLTGANAGVNPMEIQDRQKLVKAISSCLILALFMKDTALILQELLLLAMCPRNRKKYTTPFYKLKKGR